MMLFFLSIFLPIYTAVYLPMNCLFTVDLLPIYTIAVDLAISCFLYPTLYFILTFIIYLK